MRDPYEVLGVARDATPEQINKSYRKFSKHYHPDRNVGDEDAKKKYLEVQEAFQQIQNPTKQQGFGTFDPFGWMGGWNPFGSQDARMPKVVNVSLTVEELFSGCKKKINYRKGSCKACNGSGSKKQDSCKSCNGQGVYVQRQGNMTIQTHCPVCSGKGKVNAESCSDCEGTGSGENTEHEVNFPAGLKPGQRVRFEDALIDIDIIPHEFFLVSDSGIVVIVPITPAQAMANREVLVPTPGGSVSVKIPTEALLGKPVRLKGIGPNKSDIFVKFEIDIKMQSEDTKEAYREAAVCDEKNPTEAIADYLKRVNNWTAEKSP